MNESNEKSVSHQIGVYKTGKCLIELTDSLKASVSYFPAHVHAQGTKYKVEKDSQTSKRKKVRLSGSTCWIILRAKEIVL